MQTLQYSLTGLGGGAAIALLAIGLVLTYRSSNVVNLAHGAMGMYGAYAYYGLRNFKIASTEIGGDLILPILGLPAKVHVIDRPTVATALTVALLVSALLGAAVHFLVFRPLRTAPPLARVIASLGIFLYLQSVMNMRVESIGQGASSFALHTMLPKGSVRFGEAHVPTSSFVLAGVAVAIAIALAVVMRTTRFGLSTRAAAEHEKGAVLTGISPDRIGLANWVLATCLGALAVILVAGTTQKLDPTETSLLVVPALAAALLGGLDGFALTTAAGLAIGMAQGAIGFFQLRATWLPAWLPNGGLRQALPVLVVLVAITVRGRSLPARDAIIDQRLPYSPRPTRPTLWAAVFATTTIVALLQVGPQWRLAIVVSTIAALIGLSSVVLTGYVGQISLAQYAFAGLAAFLTAKFATSGIAFPWSPLLAVLITVAVGILSGLPAVRVRGMTLAVATIATAVLIEDLVFASPSLTGLGALPRPRLFGIDLGFSAAGRENFRAAFGIAAVVVLAAAMLAVANLRRSPTGLRWLAVRNNERAAAAAGIDVAATKLSAFAVSSLLAAFGGVLIAYESPALSPQQFMVVGAIAVLALTYLGGIASLGGALVAGVLASGGLLTQAQGGATGSASSTQFAISGIMLVVVTIVAPDGVLVTARAALARVRLSASGGAR